MIRAVLLLALLAACSGTAPPRNESACARVADRGNPVRAAECEAAR